MWVCPNDGWQNEDDAPFCVCCAAPRPAGGGLPADEASGELMSGIVEDENISHQHDEPPSGYSRSRRTGMTRLAGAPTREDNSKAIDSETLNEVLVLTDIRAQKRLIVDLPFGVIGREGDFNPEILNNTVSRQHLIVAQREGVWTVKNVGRTDSIIFAQNRSIAIPNDVEYPLSGGEGLRLGNMLFEVSVEAVGQENPVVIQEELGMDLPAPGQIEGWFVDCDVCGHAILVDDGNARVDSCPCCVDPFDKRQVSHKTPVFGYRREDMVFHAD